MTERPVCDDPMQFSVWANVDAPLLRQAAEHLATVVPLSLAQLYQLVKQASVENRKVQIYSMIPYENALARAAATPNGFVIGSGVVAEDVVDPHFSAYCPEHTCFYGRNCSVCGGHHL